MKSSVIAILGGALFVVLLGAYLFAYATTVRDPVEWKNGDMIVLNARETGTLPVFSADGSRMTQIGIVAVSDNGKTVISATDKVAETPLRDFLDEAQDDAYSVYRVAALTDAQRDTVVAAARRQLGKPGDYFLRRSWEQFYSSELVKLAYSDIRFDLGRLQRINKIRGDLSQTESQFARRWEGYQECRSRNLDLSACWDLWTKQEVVTPASIVADVNVKMIYERRPADGSMSTSLSFLGKTSPTGTAPQQQ